MVGGILTVASLLTVTFVVFYLWDIVFELYLENDENWKGRLYGALALSLAVAGTLIGTVAVLGAMTVGWVFVSWLF